MGVRTLPQLLDHCFKISEPEKPAYIHGDLELSFGELRFRLNKLCNFLRDVGISKSTHLGILLPNSLEFVLSYLAAGKLGAVSIPMNFMLRGESLRYLIDHCDAQYLITSGELWDRSLSKISSDLDKLEGIILTSPNSIPISGLELHRFQDYQEYPAETPDSSVDPADLLSIIYTSGTTGMPKGVLITHEFFLDRLITSASLRKLSSRDRVYYMLPLFHTAGIFSMLRVLYTGSTLIIASWFSASRFWDEICKYKPNRAVVTGIVIPALLQQPMTPKERQALKYLEIMLGFPAMPSAYISQARSRWPQLKFGESYGMTEFPFISGYSHEDSKAPMGSCGKPLPDVELEIRDSEGKPLGVNRVGEIVIRHKKGLMFSGYYKDPQATAEAIRDGWFHTGDLGKMDEEGNLWFVDRAKDCLRISGENVSSIQVENIIKSHPKVEDAAVIGVEGELGKQEILAYVIPRAGLDLEDLVRYCSSNLAYFMVPRYWVMVRSLPRTATGRVRKYLLRQAGIPKDAFDRIRAGIKLERW